MNSIRNRWKAFLLFIILMSCAFACAGNIVEVATDAVKDTSTEEAIDGEADHCTNHFNCDDLETGNCPDLSTSENCGTCGLSCFGGQCVAGLCAIERVSLIAGGGQAPSISQDGRFVTYHNRGEIADGVQRVYIYDRETDTTIRVPDEADGGSYSASISGSGEFVAFESSASNLVESDTNGIGDTFVFDLALASISRVSVDSLGHQGTGESNEWTKTSISGDGNLIAFTSRASGLVAGDESASTDVFVHNRSTSETIRVSVDSEGHPGNGPSRSPDISQDGRFVAFVSSASNLVEADTNEESDVFVHDLESRRTIRISVTADGVEANFHSFAPSISADGSVVAFTSEATNFSGSVPDDRAKVLLFESGRGTSLLRFHPEHGQGDSGCSYPSLSADGRFVAFNSGSENLVENDANGGNDIFVFDRVKGTTTLISASIAGTSGNGESFEAPEISADGRFVAFSSEASDLVPDDTNGVVDIFVAAVPQ